MQASTRRVCLVVIDGWGIADTRDCRKDAIRDAHPETMIHLETVFPTTRLIAHGSDVGLPAGLMGNSEVGHLNIGAGRTVYQDIVRIDKALVDGQLEKQFLGLLKPGFPVHLVGLVSDGGVHSSLDHLHGLLSICKKNGIEVHVHAITDGRDTSPKSALKYLATIKDDLATVIGRYYAMDRDKRWERTQLALDSLVDGGAPTFDSFDDLQSIIEAKYESAETDEFFKPAIRLGSSRLSGNVVFFNFRSDRMRQLVCKLKERDDLNCICMTRYSEDFDLPVLSPPQKLTNVLSEVISKAGLKQSHIAETEKYPHVTFFFNGGREEPFEGETRKLVASPKVATYDLKPEMSVAEVASAIAESVADQSFSFVMANLAPPDMVGHTGNHEATVEAVKRTDHAIKTIFDACQAHRATLVITADHGNAEQMTDCHGDPHTAHTCSPVPLIVCQTGADVSACKALCDVAPLVLRLMGLQVPAEMIRA